MKQVIFRTTVLAALMGTAGIALAQAPSEPASRESVKAEARVQNRNNDNSMVPKGEATTTVNHQPNAMPQPTGERSRAEVSQEARKVKPHFGEKGERPEVATNPTDKTGTPK
ncbi:serine/threonine protein kinase [Variovorax sp. PAMC26660]|uniref:serine/threonine protein kinase n=1 Tax=Variovorax sp. PAMC26660 TaxID=2762322 RepID=UPI00164D0EB8|nr:serine/threonine protein kinase [Variovorax sp. PAMC26660]QNK70324.1 serine/threonine protein kinase [Variovorax sp. PAMC26660]